MTRFILDTHLLNTSMVIEVWNNNRYIANIYSKQKGIKIISKFNIEVHQSEDKHIVELIIHD